MRKPCQYRTDTPTKDSFGKLASTSLNNYSSLPLLGFSAAVGHLTYWPSYPPTAFLSSTNHPTKLTSVLQEVVRLVDPTPLPQSPFKPLRKDSLV